MLTLKGRNEARGLRVVSVATLNGDDPEEAKGIAEAAREEHMAYPCFLDRGSAWQQKAGTEGAVPYFMVIDREGRLAFKHHGKVVEGSPAFEELDHAIARALGPGR